MMLMMVTDDTKCYCFILIGFSRRLVQRASVEPCGTAPGIVRYCWTSSLEPSN